MMDLSEFETAARAFLDASAPRKQAGGGTWGVGDDVLSGYAARTDDQERERLRVAREWMQREFDAGFGWISGPAAKGGRGLDADYERAYSELRALYEIPSLSVYTISLGMVAPTYEMFGRGPVQDLVPKLFRGDLLGCQLFSEPGAGSDLAGLSSRVERDGDTWVLNGQKVWTSVAHLADWGLLLARSNPDAPKHRGITAFALDMRSPGVEVRPLKMMTKGTEFNEVYFTDVRIDDAYRLGEVDSGWTVAIATLMNERALGAAGSDVTGLGKAFERLKMLVALPGMGADDPLVRQDLARIHSWVEMIRYQSLAADHRRRAGLPAGPAESLFKLVNGIALAQVVALSGKILGAKVTADTGEWGTYSWADMILTMPAMGLAGGSDEVLRNILSERVLGLPKEPGLK